MAAKSRMINAKTARSSGAPLIKTIEYNKLDGFFLLYHFDHISPYIRTCVLKHSTIRWIPRNFITRLNDKLYKNLNLQISLSM